MNWNNVLPIAVALYFRSYRGGVGLGVIEKMRSISYRTAIMAGAAFDALLSLALLWVILLSGNGRTFLASGFHWSAAIGGGFQAALFGGLLGGLLVVVNEIREHNGEKTARLVALSIGGATVLLMGLLFGRFVGFSWAAFLDARPQGSLFLATILLGLIVMGLRLRAANEKR